MPERVPDKPAVCILIGTFFPVVGGGETHAKLLGRELVRLGTPVTVVTRRTDRSLKRREMMDGVAVHRVTAPASPRMGKYMMLLPAFLHLIALRKEYDIIYVCALRVLGIAGLAAARLLGKPCVLRAEACGELSGDFVRQSFGAPPEKPLSPLIRLLLRCRNRFFMKADCFLSISDLVADEFRGCGVTPQQHRSIPCGLDTERFVPPEGSDKARQREALHLPDGFIFAYAGKLNKGKGLDLLIEAFKTVADRRPDLHLLLVGGGAEHSLSCEQALREQVADSSIADRVTFTGYVANVETYLQAVDAFVFPSLEESFGLAPLEAMATGLPVVVTAVGEMTQLIVDGENGLLVEPGNVTALHAAMQRLLDDAPLAKRMGKRGRETVVAQLGIRRVAEEHQAMFADLCADRSTK